MGTQWLVPVLFNPIHRILERQSWKEPQGSFLVQPLRYTEFQGGEGALLKPQIQDCDPLSRAFQGVSPSTHTQAQDKKWRGWWKAKGGEGCAGEQGEL